VLDFLGTVKVQTKRDSGVGMWIQEIGNYLRRRPFSALLRYHIFPAWRDFYTHVLAAFPRVSMGRSFQEKYEDVQWELNSEHFEAWRTGQTGVPIVDAGIRQANTMGVLSEVVH
jgi:deoxyribodipyrimidine photo-lyase